MDNFDFLDKIYTKKVFSAKIWRILQSQISLGTKLTILTFWTKFDQKAVSSVENGNRIVHIRISIGTKLQHKLTVLTFWTKFAQKWYSQSKTEEVNTTTELYIFELV